MLRLADADRDSPRRLLRVYIFALSCALLALLLSLRFGSVPDAETSLIVQLRLPRAILAAAVGMGLSVAGTALQALFSNPLCEPYTLGISSGSALGAVLGVGLGLASQISGLAPTAFMGAAVFAAILQIIARRSGSSGYSLLLSGVMLSFLGSSLVALWMALADSNGLQGAILWLMGDLSRARLGGSLFSFVSAAFLCLLIWTRSRDLDALLMGEETAASLGVEVSTIRRQVLLWTSLLIGLCVSGSGMIGFVGLVVPHFVRRITGALHLHLIPLVAIWGAVCLMLADTLARSLFSPLELPVGVVTALVGAPVFILLLAGGYREGH